MTTYQTGANVVVATKRESTFGTLAGAAGAKALRIAPSPGSSLKKTPVKPTETRNDAQTTQVRHGSRMVDGQYNGDLYYDQWNDWLESLLRGTWLASFTIDQATMTSITTTTSSIVAAG